MKKSRRLISFVLALMLVFTLSIPAFAADSNGEECPVIYIPGIATSKIYNDKDDTSTLVTYPDSEIILALVKETIVPSLLTFSADRDADKLASKICAELNTTFAEWFNNPDGSAKGNAGAHLVYPSPSSIRAGGQYTFDYDWRGNPVEIAAELNGFIEYIISNSKFDKVTIASHSLGNIIALSYISIYGNDDVQGIVFDSPAINGVSYVGDLFCGEMVLNAESIDFFLKELLGTTEYEELMVSIVDVFNLAGIPEMLSVFLNDIIDKIAPTLYKDTLIPLCGRWLTIWAMCPDDRIDDAMNSVFNGYCKDEDLSALKAKIEEFNSKVRDGKHQTLLDFDKEGRVAVISRYGFSSLPITPSYDLMSDTVIETASTSLGATTATLGKCFDEAYLEGKDLAYISPDKTVDASTCLFPEKTWFIKNLKHADTSVTKNFYKSFLFSAEEATTDNHVLSRFSYYDAETDTIIEDVTSPEPNEKLSPLQVLFNFLKALFNKFIEFFR